MQEGDLSANSFGGGGTGVSENGMGLKSVFSVSNGRGGG